MLSLAFHHLVPSAFCGAHSAFPVLAGINRELHGCVQADQAADAADRAKAELYARLRARFPPVAAQALTIKILNLLLARFHFRSRSTVVLSRPFGLVVDPTNACQLACPGCVHSERAEALRVFDWPNGTLAAERFAALLGMYGPYAIGVYFCSYGEPLLNLNTPRLVRLAKTYLLGTALSSSLSVRRFDAEAYVESGLDFMVVSIDGATQPVYERFRRRGNLDLVLDNLSRLVKAKRRLGRRTPVLSWNFLAFEHNAHEIPLALRLARRLGVNQFRVVNPFGVAWDDPEVRPAGVKASVRRLDWRSTQYPPENWNPFPDAVPAGTIARAFESPWRRPAPRDERPSIGSTCHWLYKNLVMDAAGRILPCCGAPRPDTNLVFASLDGQADPFNTEKYRAARAFFSTGLSTSMDAPHCTRCEWDHTAVNIGEGEIRRYFRAADAAFFDRRSLQLLSAW